MTAPQYNRFARRNVTLKAIRSPRLEHWRDITQFLLPYAGRYLLDRDRTVGEYQDIIDETGLQAVDVFVAGMVALRTNPASPWFRFQTPDPQRNKAQEGRRWLFLLQTLAQDILRRSNTYLMYPEMYEEVGVFGNAASIMADHYENVIHHFPLTAGEFCIAKNGMREIDTLYREFVMSVSEVVQEFGEKNCSETVKTAFANERYDDPVHILHVIEPRKDRVPGARDAKNMPWKSCYMELTEPEGRYLRESGHRSFPCLTPQWRVKGSDVWGEGLGSKALGSVRQLHIEQMSKARAMEQQANPALQVPTALAARDRDLLPGGVLPYDQTTPYGGVRTAYEVPLRLDFMREDIEDVRRRIQRSFYVPQFQALTMLSDSTQRTVSEIAGRQAESLSMLGPATQRLQEGIDEPLLERVVERIFELNLMPPPPPELQGQPLQIDFIGPLAQALKMVAAQNTDRFVFGLGTVAAMKPEVVDKFNADGWADFASDTYGVDPDLIVAGKDVVLIREARAKAMAAKEQAAMMPQLGRGAKDLAAASLEGENALTALTGGG